jgi:GNAT superfamily N-acetyltransferase
MSSCKPECNGTTTRKTLAPAGPAELALRPAARTDAVPLNFFFDSVLRKDYFLRRGQLTEMLHGPHHQVLVAEIGDILVGVAVTTRGTRLVNVLVHPAYRGLGIGLALVQATAATEVRAKLDMSTGDPRGFYRKLGFEQPGQPEPHARVQLMRRPTRTCACATTDPPGRVRADHTSQNLKAKAR